MRARVILAVLLAACSDRALDGPAGSATPDLGRTDLAPAPDLSSTLTCGGIAGTACPPGFSCEEPAGECFDDATGNCVLIPPTCPNHTDDPVCGCDGHTYVNDCDRRLHGVPLDHPGACASAFACGDSTCGPDDICVLGCCGVPGCTPPAPSCQAPPVSCQANLQCGCLMQAEGPSTCSEIDGHFYLQLEGCP